MASLTKAQLQRIDDRINKLKAEKLMQIEEFVFQGSKILQNPLTRIYDCYGHRGITDTLHREINPDDYDPRQREAIEAFNQAYVYYHHWARKELEEKAAAVAAPLSEQFELKRLLIADLEQQIEALLDSITFIDNKDLASAIQQAFAGLESWSPLKG